MSKRLNQLGPLFILAAMMIIVSGIAPAFAQAAAPPGTYDYTVSWTIPTTYENGSALAVTDISGYTLYDVTPGGSGAKQSITGGTTTSITYNAPQCVTRVLAITATAGLESKKSATASITTPCGPGAPTNLKATLKPS